MFCAVFNNFGFGDGAVCGGFGEVICGVLGKERHDGLYVLVVHHAEDHT